MGNSTQKAPQYLSRQSKTWWRRVVGEYEMKTGGELALVTEAASSLDRIAECRAVIERDGLCIEGSRGLVAHPAARLEQQHRQLVIQCCRTLGISSPVEDD